MMSTTQMTTGEIVTELAKAIEGRRVNLDGPTTRNLLWAFFYRCAHEGSDIAIEELTPEAQ